MTILLKLKVKKLARVRKEFLDTLPELLASGKDIGPYCEFFELGGTVAAIFGTDTATDPFFENIEDQDSDAVMMDFTHVPGEMFGTHRLYFNRDGYVTSLGFTLDMDEASITVTADSTVYDQRLSDDLGCPASVVCDAEFVRPDGPSVFATFQSKIGMGPSKIHFLTPAATPVRYHATPLMPRTKSA